MGKLSSGPLLPYGDESTLGVGDNAHPLPLRCCLPTTAVRSATRLNWGRVPDVGSRGSVDSGARIGGLRGPVEGPTGQNPEATASHATLLR
jgi:hypothetical protein